MWLDAAIVRYLNSLVGKSTLFDGVIVTCGLYLPYLTALSFFLFLFFSAEAQKRLTIFLLAACATITARFVVTELIRLFYKRPRPFVSHELRPLIAQHQWSFPSGHAAFFFALAGVVYYFDALWGVGFLVAALLTTFSRVVAGVHYPSDILSGAFIGLLSAYASVILISLF